MAQAYYERKGEQRKHSRIASLREWALKAMNYSNSTDKKTTIGEWTRSEWTRGERSFDAYPPSVFAVRADKENAEGQYLEHKLTSATLLVYGMSAAVVVVQTFLLGTIQQWW